LPPDWKVRVTESNYRIALTISAFGITVELVFTYDETFAKFFPALTRTYAEAGKDCKILGSEKKDGVTITLCADMTGNVLPFQVIYQGISSACVPGYKPKSKRAQKIYKPLASRVAADAAGFLLCFSGTHWQLYAHISPNPPPPHTYKHTHTLNP
jgi:hypothetical protein